MFKKKRILIIPWTISDGGGSEKILSNILNELDNENVIIDIFEIQRGKRTKYIEKFSNLKFKYLFDKKDPNEKIVNKISRKIKFTVLKYFPLLIKKIYIKEKYDFVISFNYLYPSFLAAKFECKKIMWLHGTMDNLTDESEHVLKKLQSKALNKADKIVSIAQTTKKSVDTLFPECKQKSIIINNGVDLDEIRKKSEVHISENYKSDLIFIGRLDKNKNVEFLVDVMNLLCETKKNLKLTILGEGDERDNIQNLIKGYNLENNVKILGYKENVYKYIKNSKILLLSSIVEGFPTVIVEGMVLGKPFIATSVGGVEELSHNSTCGFVINSKKTMAEKISILIEDKELYQNMSINCIDKVSKYTMNYQKEKIIDLLEI